MADEVKTPRAGMLTLEQASALLMRSKERVLQLVRAGFIPKAARNEYPLVGVVQGYIKFRDDEDRSKTRVAADSGLKQARQSEIEMRMAERRRDLVKRAEAEAAMDMVVGQINEEFSGFAARVSRDAGIRRQIETALDDALNRIAGKLDGAKVALASGGTDGPAQAEDAS